ncbi:MAG TPA: organomercurial lyase [Gemmatimonadaceae bacterium]|nr:organomercurial lyase [Gemmatimonadaceae bacterium]
MISDTDVKLAIYRMTAASGRVPTAQSVADALDSGKDEVLEAFGRLAAQRLLALEPDGQSIRMAPPFSAVPTQHRVLAGGVEYHANCAWDALGIPAALHLRAEVISRCEQSGAPLHLSVMETGPVPTSWLFHCQVPAALWWKDIVFT